MLEVVPLFPSCLLLRGWNSLYVGLKPRTHFALLYQRVELWAVVITGIPTHQFDNFVNSWLLL